MNLEKVLQKYGLNEKQAKVYLAGLELGSASVYKIAQKSTLPRSTCYEILDDLKNWGLVSTYQKKKVRFYNAESPQRAIELAREKTEILEKALPQLVAMYGSAKERPVVRFYQGRRNAELVLSDMLEAKEISGFSSADDLINVFGPEHFKFLAKRIKKKIPIRLILWDSPLARERKKIGPKEYREVKIISAKYKHTGSFFVFGNKIAMFLYDKEKLMSLLIESDGLAGVQRSFFNCLWDNIKETD